MRKHIATALASAALAWLGGNAIAGDPVSVVPHSGCCIACDSGPKGGWYGSAGVLFLKQTGTRDLAYQTRLFDETPPPEGPILLSTTASEFGHDYNLSGRLELGWKDCRGLGARLRFFWIEDDSSVSILDDAGFQSDPNFPGLVFSQISGIAYHSANPLGIGFTTVGTADAPSLFSADSDLKLQSWDLDFTSDCHCGCLEMTWAAGLRYLHIAQNYNASDVVLDPSTLIAPAVIPIAQVLRSGHNINAFGPTIGLEARYPVWDGLKALGQARFGLLYMQGKQTVGVSEIPLDPENYQPLVGFSYGATEERCGALPVGELELGGEYTRCLGCNGPELFVRGTVLSQVYWGAGRAARVNLNNNPSNEDLIFFGLAVDVGVRY